MAQDLGVHHNFFRQELASWQVGKAGQDSQILY